MKIISFNEGQHGEEWLSWRKNGIGASDISIVMGNSPYKTPLQLWEIKCGYREEDKMNRAMEHGIKTEDIARQWINQNKQFNLKPICIEDEEKPYFRASLDGFDFNQEVLVEIKCPVNEKVLEKARINQSVPSYWYDQVQWQIMLSNPKHALIALWDFRHNNCICIDLFGQTKYIEKMRKTAAEFWHNVQIGKAPEALKEDYVEIEDDKLYELLSEYRDLSQKEKVLSDRRKEIKSQIEEFGDGTNFTAFGFKVQHVTASPRYDIEQMRFDGIPIEKYIKKSDRVGWYRIFPPKN